MTDTARAQEMPLAAANAPVPTPQIADPAPLGLAAFAMTTFVLSVFNTNMISDVGLRAVVLPLALFYGGIAQFAAGMWEFRKGNTFGALAFTSYGAFWLSLATYLRFVVPGLARVTNLHTATGLYLLGWTIFTLYMILPAIRVSGAVAAVFVALTFTFACLCAGEYANSTTWTKVGGWGGIITAAVAWYASMAGVTNATWRRPLLPTFPTGVVDVAAVESRRRPEHAAVR